jgi:endonuclease/exonuclease/phosphatase (EEP) superfamily protein YafD
MPYSFLPQSFSPDAVLHMVGSARQPCFSAGSPLRLLVWNIYKARNQKWQEDFIRLTEEKDLILLQESVFNTKHDSLFQSPDKLEWVMAQSYKNPKSGMATGVKTGACAVSTVRRFFNSPDREPLINTSKMLLATTYQVEGGLPLLTLNIHAINFVSFQKYGRQTAQIIEAVEGHEGPVILAGDFNTWTISRLKQLHEITNMLGLISVPMEKRTRWSHLNKTLDHVFYKGLTFKSAELHFDIQTSDHYPITVEFTL